MASTTLLPTFFSPKVNRFSGSKAMRNAAHLARREMNGLNGKGSKKSIGGRTWECLESTDSDGMRSLQGILTLQVSRLIPASAMSDEHKAMRETSDFEGQANHDDAPGETER